MKKHLGQVFLRDKNILNKIVQAADVDSSDSCVEVGCGEGVLSAPLCERAKHLTIIEIDPTYYNFTKARFARKTNVSFILGDVLKLGFSDVAPESFKVVANIPYYISAKFIKLLAENSQRVQDVTLLVQKEFAEKLIAVPSTKSYTSLTVWTRFHFDVTYLFSVSKTCFYPVPQVDSAVIKLMPKKIPISFDSQILFNVVRSAFWARRKTLLNCLQLSPYLTFKPGFDQTPFLLKNPVRRGETLELSDFMHLASELAPFVIEMSHKPMVD